MTPVDVAKLPRKTLRAGTALYRIHQSHLGPWFFASSDAGRFNPTGVSGRGACYWAEKQVGAWVESFRTVMTWTTGDLAKRSISAIELTEDLVVRDLTVKRALNAGVTVAMTGGSDYSAAQELAGRLQDVSDGVRYRVSHDLSAKLVGIAWFGDAGAAEGRQLAELPAADTADIRPELIEEASRLFGYKVLPTPV